LEPFSRDLIRPKLLSSDEESGKTFIPSACHPKGVGAPSFPALSPNVSFQVATNLIQTTAIGRKAEVTERPFLAATGLAAFRLGFSEVDVLVGDVDVFHL
jgi:hypothetical protein